MRSGLQVFQRSAEEVQFGLDHRWAIRLAKLSPEEVGTLISLPRTLPSLAGAVLDSLSEGLRTSLLAAGILIAQPEEAAGSQSSAQVIGPHPDAPAWAQLRADDRGDQTISARGARTVGVLGLGRLGLRIAQCLATAGVGRLVLEDNALVRRLDLGLGGYTLRDVNQPRRECAARLVAESTLGINPEHALDPTYPSSPVRGSVNVEHEQPVQISAYDPETDLSKLDLVVVIGFGTVDPARMWRLISEQVPHLPIVWGEAGATIGPVVLPGRTPCLRCLDLHRRDADIAWPLVAAQLHANTDAGFAEESLIANTASAIAVGQILGIIDGRGPGNPGQAVEVNLPDGLPRVRDWAPHPDCGCMSIPESSARS